MWLYRLLVLFGVFVGTFTNAAQPEYCSVVLQEQAFNKERSSNVESYASAKRNELCSRNYSSLDEAKQAAFSAGFDTSYGIFDLGASGSQSTGSQSISIKDSKFCKSTAEDLRSSQISSYESVIADVAVKAWLERVKYSEKPFLYMTYKTLSDGMSFSGTLYWKPLGNTDLYITGITVTPITAKVRCVVDGREVPAASAVGEQKFLLGGSEKSISCQKFTDESVVISISTSENSLPGVVLPSKIDIEVDKYERLENLLLLIKRRVADHNAVINCHEERLDRVQGKPNSGGNCN